MKHLYNIASYAHNMCIYGIMLGTVLFTLATVNNVSARPVECTFQFPSIEAVDVHE